MINLLPVTDSSFNNYSLLDAQGNLVGGFSTFREMLASWEEQARTEIWFVNETTGTELRTDFELGS